MPGYRDYVMSVERTLLYTDLHSSSVRMNLKPWSCNVSGGSEGWHVSSKQQVLHAEFTIQHLGRSPMAWCSDCAREAHEGGVVGCHDKLLQQSAAYISRAPRTV